MPLKQNGITCRKNVNNYKKTIEAINEERTLGCVYMCVHGERGWGCGADYYVFNASLHMHLNTNIKVLKIDKYQYIP